MPGTVVCPGVPAFLSPEWLDMLGAALPDPDPSISLRIEQLVTGTPTGDVRYQIVLDGGKSWVDGVASEPADITLRLPYDVAVQMTTGALSPEDALQSGALRVGGDVRRLASVRVFADVRDRTTYP
jgi:hypothetical protein